MFAYIYYVSKDKHNIYPSSIHVYTGCTEIIARPLYLHTFSEFSLQRLLLTQTILYGCTYSVRTAYRVTKKPSRQSSEMFLRIWQYFPNTLYIVWTLLIEEPRLINPRQGLSAIKSGSAKSDHNTRYKNFSKNLFSSSLRMVNMIILISFEEIRDNLWRQLHSFLNPSQ